MPPYAPQHLVLPLATDVILWVAMICELPTVSSVGKEAVSPARTTTLGMEKALSHCLLSCTKLWSSCGQYHDIQNKTPALKVRHNISLCSCPASVRPLHLSEVHIRQEVKVPGHESLLSTCDRLSWKLYSTLIDHDFP